MKKSPPKEQPEKLPAMDDVLRRMLATPPQPHKPKTEPKKKKATGKR